MELNLNEAFPVTQEHFRKLLKVIDLDFEHRDDILRRLEEYFCTKIEKCLSERASYANSYDYNSRLVCEAEERIKREGLSADNRKALRKFKCEARTALDLWRVYERDLKSYEGHLKKVREAREV